MISGFDYMIILINLNKDCGVSQRVASVTEKIATTQKTIYE